MNSGRWSCPAGALVTQRPDPSDRHVSRPRDRSLLLLSCQEEVWQGSFPGGHGPLVSYPAAFPSWGPPPQFVRQPPRSPKYKHVLLAGPVPASGSRT